MIKLSGSGKVTGVDDNSKFVELTWNYSRLWKREKKRKKKEFEENEEITNVRTHKNCSCQEWTGDDPDFHCDSLTFLLKGRVVLRDHHVKIPN